MNKDFITPFICKQCGKLQTDVTIKDFTLKGLTYECSC